MRLTRSLANSHVIRALHSVYCPDMESDEHPYLRPLVTFAFIIVPQELFDYGDDHHPLEIVPLCFPLPVKLSQVFVVSRPQYDDDDDV